MLAILGLTVAGWGVGSVFAVHPSVVAAGAVIAAAATGNLERRTIQQLDWSYLIYYGVALSIAGLAVSLGFGRLAQGAMGSTLAPVAQHPLVFILLVAGASVLAQLILSKTQAVLLLGLALIPLAPAVGINPWIIVITLLVTASMWFTPAQTTSYLVGYSAVEGRLYSHGQARRAAFGYLVVVLAGLVCTTPYWRLLGLIR